MRPQRRLDPRRYPPAGRAIAYLSVHPAQPFDAAIRAGAARGRPSSAASLSADAPPMSARETPASRRPARPGHEFRPPRRPAPVANVDPARRTPTPSRARPNAPPAAGAASARSNGPPTGRSPAAAASGPPAGRRFRAVRAAAPAASRATAASQPLGRGDRFQQPLIAGQHPVDGGASKRSVLYSMDNRRCRAVLDDGAPHSAMRGESPAVSGGSSRVPAAGRAARRLFW